VIIGVGYNSTQEKSVNFDIEHDGSVKIDEVYQDMDRGPKVIVYNDSPQTLAKTWANF